MTERKCLYGTRSSNTLAYCHKHHCALTPQQLKQKQCLAKHCNALQKHEHPYWEQREKSKQKRKERKVRLEKLYEERGRANEICSKAASANSGRVPKNS